MSLRVAPACISSTARWLQCRCLRSGELTHLLCTQSVQPNCSFTRSIHVALQHKSPSCFRKQQSLCVTCRCWLDPVRMYSHHAHLFALHTELYTYFHKETAIAFITLSILSHSHFLCLHLWSPAQFVTQRAQQWLALLLLICV